MCRVSRRDRCRNSDVRERCGLKEDVAPRVERGVLRRSGVWRGRMKADRQHESMGRMCVVERSARVALENPMQTKFFNIQNRRRACMKKLMNVRETREICKERTM
ncbi:hypothetical protein EVAR_18313_1 [Eumeta japonica]|uniref:Uncharacterized protein n=1 Tax=Eumeta variegata TaxID=151549 RepID=A0A4C1V8J1_EUMVA|nr:hypothetical protein EVAR_18313_1 [Eumeta japonica]